MKIFEIQGGKKLSGEITVNSSKNAAVALILGALINRGKTKLKNVPQIEEVNRLLEVLESVGVQFIREERNITIIPPEKILLEKMDILAAQKTRSAILLLGALSGRLKKYLVPQSGGCRLGSRTVRPHLFALENFGMKIAVEKNGFRVEADKLHPAKRIVLYESGDTVTENTLLVAAQIPGKTVIRLASANYMVQDLCFFLEKLGVKMRGIGTATLEIEGLEKIDHDVEYEISEDPIEAMFFISLAASCGSELLIKRCPIEFLELEMIEDFGAYCFNENEVMQKKLKK